MGLQPSTDSLGMSATFLDALEPSRQAIAYSCHSISAGLLVAFNFHPRFDGFSNIHIRIKGVFTSYMARTRDANYSLSVLSYPLWSDPQSY